MSIKNVKLLTNIYESRERLPPRHLPKRAFSGSLYESTWTGDTRVKGRDIVNKTQVRVINNNEAILVGHVWVGFASRLAGRVVAKTFFVDLLSGIRA